MFSVLSKNQRQSKLNDYRGRIQKFIEMGGGGVRGIIQFVRRFRDLLSVLCEFNKINFSRHMITKSKPKKKALDNKV